LVRFCGETDIAQHVLIQELNTLKFVTGPNMQATNAGEKCKHGPEQSAATPDGSKSGSRRYAQRLLRVGASVGGRRMVVANRHRLLRRFGIA